MGLSDEAQHVINSLEAHFNAVKAAVESPQHPGLYQHVYDAFEEVLAKLEAWGVTLASAAGMGAENAADVASPGEGEGIAAGSPTAAGDAFGVGTSPGVGLSAVLDGEAGKNEINTAESAPTEQASSAAAESAEAQISGEGEKSSG